MDKDRESLQIKGNKSIVDFLTNIPMFDSLKPEELSPK